MGNVDGSGRLRDTTGSLIATFMAAVVLAGFRGIGVGGGLGKCADLAAVIGGKLAQWAASRTWCAGNNLTSESLISGETSVLRPYTASICVGRFASDSKRLSDEIFLTSTLSSRGSEVEENVAVTPESTWNMLIRR
jgi:hypothetical protein